MNASKSGRAVVLIPAYKPDEKMVTLVSELREKGLDVLLVDDGGGEAYAPLFEKCRALGAQVAVHVVNLGKGRALKTGINAALTLWPDLCGIVTADADGQHAPKDILRIIDALHEHPDDLILGCRKFTGDVPAKSRWGNRITRCVYRVVSGVAVSDTQTGLRALPRKNLEKQIRIQGERYEYEMNVLLQLRELELGVFEVPIETIYINDNAGSHFNPVKDAIRIYSVILRQAFLYLFSSLSSAAIDWALYLLLMDRARFSAPVSFALARLVSSQYNFQINKNAVFGGRGGRYAMLKYYLLAACQLALGTALVAFLPRVLPLSEKWVKLPVDIALFCASYFIQRDYVFKK